jgi:hypothetical protein
MPKVSGVLSHLSGYIHSITIFTVHFYPLQSKGYLGIRSLFILYKKNEEFDFFFFFYIYLNYVIL